MVLVRMHVLLLSLLPGEPFAPSLASVPGRWGLCQTTQILQHPWRRPRGSPRALAPDSEVDGVLLGERLRLKIEAARRAVREDDYEWYMQTVEPFESVAIGIAKDEKEDSGNDYNSCHHTLAHVGGAAAEDEEEKIFQTEVRTIGSDHSRSGISSAEASTKPGARCYLDEETFSQESVVKTDSRDWTLDSMQQYQEERAVWSALAALGYAEEEAQRLSRDAAVMVSPCHNHHLSGWRKECRSIDITGCRAFFSKTSNFQSALTDELLIWLSSSSSSSPSLPI